MKFRTIVFSFLLIGALLVAITPVQADNHIDSGYIDTNDVSSAKFATDRVLVTLTHDASLKFATYSAASFSEISCKGVTDLTSDIGEKVQQKLTQTATAEKTATFTKSASTFMKNLDINSYKQILCLHLSEPGENNVLAAIKSLSSNPAVYSASPDYIMYTEAETVTIPNDPRYNDQWGLEFINMPEAWDLATSSNMITVAVIDSGIDASHEDLGSKIHTSISRQYYFELSNPVSSNGGCVDNYGHGTKSSYSNYGATGVDIFAPGDDILTCQSLSVCSSACNYCGYHTNNGTSMATPFVSGVAALILAEDPDLTPIQVKARILNSAHQISSLSGLCVTGGYLDAAAALDS